MSRFVFAAIVALGSASVAGAANQYSSIRPFNGVSNVAQCFATNVGASSTTVSIEILDESNAVLSSIGPVAIAPGQTNSIVLLTPSPAIRCALLTSASTRNVRGSLVLYGGSLLSIADSAELR